LISLLILKVGFILEQWFLFLGGGGGEGQGEFISNLGQETNGNQSFINRPPWPPNFVVSKS
jgi:hypothetical protein